MTEIKEIKKIKEKLKEGKLFVISAPSGAGKTTLCHLLVKDIERAVYSVSVTSRKPRSKEKIGKHYFFVDEDEFMKMVEKDKLLEWARVHGNYYGTSRKFVEQNIKKGKYIVLDIDVQGGMEIKEKFPQAVLIFVMPPSMEELERRLTRRKEDTKSEIKKRIRNSYEEIKYAPKYDFMVINNKLEEALNCVKSIIIAEECRLNYIYGGYNERRKKD